MNRVRVLAVVALAALAGCSLPAGSGLPGDTPTLTPVPVDSDTGNPPAATPTPDALVPGLTADGVRNPFALANAHRNALSNQSLSRVATERIEGPNGTLWNRRAWTNTTSDRNRYYFHKNADSSEAYPVGAFRPDLEIYYDGSVSYFRGTVGEEVQYAAAGGSSASVLGDVVNRDRLIVLLGAFTFRVREMNDGYRMEAVRLRDPSALNPPPLIDDPRNVSFTVNIALDGYITSYRLAFDGTLDNRTVRVTRSIEFTGIGSTAVTEPPWYATAVNETS